MIAQEDPPVLDLHSDNGGSGLRLRLRVRVSDFGHFARLLGRLEALPGVERARRG